jgi:hypothetical protein
LALAPGLSHREAVAVSAEPGIWVPSVTGFGGPPQWEGRRVSSYGKHCRKEETQLSLGTLRSCASTPRPSLCPESCPTPHPTTTFPATLAGHRHWADWACTRHSASVPWDGRASLTSSHGKAAEVTSRAWFNRDEDHSSSSEMEEDGRAVTGKNPTTNSL